MWVIHVQVVRDEFVNILGKMREWLDRHNRPLVRFETESVGDRITVKVQFDAGDLAELFSRDFDGAYDL
jgi:hypothetical protein